MRAHTVLALILGSWLGCSKTSPNDQHVPPGDGDGDTAGYVLCDGSDEVRLAVVSGGGQVEWSYFFTNPYGHQSLYVTGKCEFLTGRSLLGEMRHGTLSASQAAHVAEVLRLDSAASWPERMDQSCPDAGGLYVKTQSGYGECGCGCDDDAPASLVAALNASGAVIDELLAAGEALPGPVELLIVEDPGVRSGAVPWTLSFDPAVVAITFDEAIAIQDDAWPSVLVEGTDAEAARQLRDAFQRRGSAYVHTDDGRFYNVYARDQVDPALDAAIRAFR